MPKLVVQSWTVQSSPWDFGRHQLPSHEAAVVSSCYTHFQALASHVSVCIGCALSNSKFTFCPFVPFREVSLRCTGSYAVVHREKLARPYPPLPSNPPILHTPLPFTPLHTRPRAVRGSAGSALTDVLSLCNGADNNYYCTCSRK